VQQHKKKEAENPPLKYYYITYASTFLVICGAQAAATAIFILQTKLLWPRSQKREI
jgi:hypothetical protein